jgi:alpha-L-fucosidase
MLVFHISAQEATENMELGWETEVKGKNSNEKQIEEWKDWGFGIFIHWSPSTALQGRFQGKEIESDLWAEWSMNRAQISIEEYEAILRGWNPKDFNAKEWGDVIEGAGCKYVVYVAKHHDGFAMFNAEANDYGISRWGAFKQDPFHELCNDLHSRDLKTGFYYSHRVDWRNKKFYKGSTDQIDNQYFEAVVKSHLKQLNTAYGLQSVVWFDLGWGNRVDLSKACVDVLREDNPNIIISSRVGGGYGDYSSQGDGYVPPIALDGAWETPLTLNDHWAWTPTDKVHKSTKEILHTLSKIRSRGGNLLINVGPDIRGKIPLRDQIILKQVGSWLKINGEAIFGAKKTPYADLPWGVCTRKSDKLYLHLFEMPSSDNLFLPGLNSKINKVYFLADKSKEELAFTKVKGGYKINLMPADKSAAVYNADVTVLVVEYEGELDINTTPTLDHDLDNRFIPQLAKTENGCITTLQRVTPILDHPTVEQPHWEEFALGFSNPKAKLSWNFNLYQNNRFAINVEYANLTDDSIDAVIRMGDQIHSVNLPSTKDKSQPWGIFTLYNTGSELINSGEELELSFELSSGSAKKELDEKYATPIERETGLKNFMLKSIILKPFFPLPYSGYSSIETDNNSK